MDRSFPAELAVDILKALRQLKSKAGNAKYSEKEKAGLIEWFIANYRSQGAVVRLLVAGVLQAQMHQRPTGELEPHFRVNSEVRDVLECFLPSGESFQPLPKPKA
jgi:hypothetical protein